MFIVCHGKLCNTHGGHCKKFTVCSIRTVYRPTVTIVSSQKITVVVVGICKCSSVRSCLGCLVISVVVGISSRSAQSISNRKNITALIVNIDSVISKPVCCYFCTSIKIMVEFDPISVSVYSRDETAVVIVLVSCYRNAVIGCDAGYIVTAVICERCVIACIVQDIYKVSVLVIGIDNLISESVSNFRDTSFCISYEVNCATVRIEDTVLCDLYSSSVCILYLIKTEFCIKVKLDTVVSCKKEVLRFKS